MTRAAETSPTFSFGLVTDAHYAEIADSGARRYRASRARLRAAGKAFAERQAAFLVELGDLIDKGPSTADDKQYLAAACEGLAAFPGSRHYVLGNHCVTTLTKAEFLEGCGQKPTLSHHYSFDHGGWHFVVLDADFRRDETSYEPGKFHWTDTWVPAAQLAWLQRDLAGHSALPCVVFVHQNLHDHTQSWGIKNADAVRKVLEASGNVVAVLQGHKHDGAYARIEGIDYYTFKAMVEGKTAEDNAYALVGLGPGRKVRIEGFGRQPSRTIR